VVLPLLGIIEKPLPVPDAISSPVLSHPATQPEGAVAAPQKD
jgi:ubiquinol-cytochrome c reductase cytochrome b subunit